MTGVAGHLGSWLAQHLLEQGDEVVGIDNLEAGFREEVPKGTEFYEADCNDDWWREQVWQRPVDVVWHCASFAAEGLSPFAREYTVRNVWGATSGVVNAAIKFGCKRLVYFSSMAVYGHGEPPFDEQDPKQPCDTYGIAKAACEDDLRVAYEYHGLDYVIIRPHNLYGPGQNIWQRYRNVLGLWMRAALEGKPIRVFGDGQQHRAFSYLADAIPAIARAGTEPKASRQIINVGGATPVSILDAAKMVSRITGAPIEHVEARKEVKMAWCTTELSEAILGFEDRTSLEDGLRDMWFWTQVAWDEYPQRRRPPAVVPELSSSIYSFWKDGQPTPVKS